MDPDEVYEDLMGLVKQVMAGETVEVEDLAGAVQDLDEWITKGGYLPKAWGAVHH